MENLRVFMTRWLLALLLVFGAYSSNGKSFYHMVTGLFEVPLSVTTFSGVVLIILAIICIQGTLQSIGFVGSLLGAAFLGALIWVLTDYEFFVIGTTDWFIYAGQIILAIILAFGMTWSRLRN